MEKKECGYNRYKVIFEYIKKMCQQEFRKNKKVIKGQFDGISEEICEEYCDLYILENGLYVYIRGENVFITESDVECWGDEQARTGDKTGQFFLAYNEETIECICHANNGMPFSIIQYFNHEEDAQNGRFGIDNVFIPNGFENWNEERRGITSKPYCTWRRDCDEPKGVPVDGGRENIESAYSRRTDLPADIENVISSYLSEDTHQDIRTICEQIIALVKKIEKYEKEAWLDKLEENSKEIEKLQKKLKELEQRCKDGNKKYEDIATEIERIAGKIAELEWEINAIQSKNSQLPVEELIKL